MFEEIGENEDGSKKSKSKKEDEKPFKRVVGGRGRRDDFDEADEELNPTQVTGKKESPTVTPTGESETFESSHIFEAGELEKNVAEKVNQVLLKDHYALLELNQEASHQEIKNAYLVALKKIANNENPPEWLSKYIDQVKERMDEAYKTLSNRKKRTKYDKDLEEKKESKFAAGGGGGAGNGGTSGPEATGSNNSSSEVVQAIKDAAVKMEESINKHSDSQKVFLDNANKEVNLGRQTLVETIQKSMKEIPRLIKEAGGDSEALAAIATMQAEMARAMENMLSMRGAISENLILPKREKILHEIVKNEGRSPTPEEMSLEYYEDYVRDWFDGNLRTLEASQESFEEWGLVLQQLVSDVNELEGNKETEVLGRELRLALEKRKNFRRFMRIYEISPFDQTAGSSNAMNNDVWEHVLTLETKNFEGKKEKMVANEFREICFMGEEIQEEMEALKRLKYKQGVLIHLKKQNEAVDVGIEISEVQTRLQTLRSELVNYVNKGGYATDTQGDPILNSEDERVFTKDQIETHGKEASNLVSEKERLENALAQYNFLINKLDKTKTLDTDERDLLDELKKIYKAKSVKSGDPEPDVKDVIEAKLKKVGDKISALDRETRKLKDDRWARLMAGRVFSASLMAGEINVPDLCGGGDFFISRPQNFGDEWAEGRGLLFRKHKAFWDPLPRKGKDPKTGMETYEEWIKRTGGEQFGGRLTFKAPNYFRRLISEEMRYQRVLKNKKDVDIIKADGAERDYSDISKELHKKFVPAQWIEDNVLHKDINAKVRDDNGTVVLDILDANGVVIKTREPRPSDYDWSKEKVWKAIRTRDDRDDPVAMEEDPRFGVAENITSRDMYDEMSSAVEMLKGVFWGNQSALHNFTLEKLMESQQYGKNVGELGRQKLWKNYLDRALWMLEDAPNVKEISQEAHITPVLEKTRFISAFADKDLITPEMEREELSEHISKKFLFYNEIEMSELKSQLDIVWAVLWRDKTFRMRTIFGSLWNALKILFKSTVAEDVGMVR